MRVQNPARSPRRLVIVATGVVLSFAAVPAGVFTGAPSQAIAKTTPGADTCGYPDNSSALSPTVFNESTVTRGIVVLGSGTSARIASWANDEKGLLLGVNGAAPFAATAGQVDGSVHNPALGDLALNDPAGRPQYPALYVTDVTTSPTDRSGDWQQGGHPTTHVDDVFGTWTTATYTGGKYTATAPPQKNNWNLGPGADAPPSSVTSFNEGYGAEVRWDASGLVDNTGQPLHAGHTYRLQVMTHDGDQNKSGGDVGEACTTLAIPGPPPQPATFIGHIFDCVNGAPSANEEAGGHITIAAPGTQPATYTNPVNQQVNPNTYLVSSTPPSGFSFVTCGSTEYQVGGGGTTATYVNALAIPSGGTGTAVFYVVPTTPPPVPNCYPLKTVSPAGAVATGTTLTYTVTAVNNASVAGPCVLSDVLSVADGASVASPQLSSPSQGSLSGAVPNLTWTITSLGAGASATFQFSVTALGTPAATGHVTNTATVTNGCVATADHPCTSTVVTPIPPPAAGPDCSPVKTGTPTGSVTPGTILTYTIVVTNNGGAGACTVNDALTATGSASFSIDTTSFTVTAGTVLPVANGWTWNVGTLASGASATLTVKVTVTGLGTVTNTATTPPSVCTANCSSTVTTPITLQLTKSVTPTGSVSIGSVLTYTITLTNTSKTDVTPATTPGGITVDDVMQGTALFTVDTSSFAGSPVVSVTQLTPSHFRWTYTTLASGASAVVTYRTTITGSGGTATTCLLGGGGVGSVCVDDTASTPGLPPVTVENVAPGQVLGITTSTPSTGSVNTFNVTVAGFLFFGGLTLVLLGLLVAPLPARGRAR